MKVRWLARPIPRKAVPSAMKGMPRFDMMVVSAKGFAELISTRPRLVNGLKILLNRKSFNGAGGFPLKRTCIG
jgi:hypothetical protein